MEKRTLLKELADGYKIYDLERSYFFEQQAPLKKEIFSSVHISNNLNAFFTDEEKKQIDELGFRVKNDPFQIYIGVFDINDNFVGWHCGFQQDSNTFYMVNSAIKKEHRHKGLYSALLEIVLGKAKQQGFQIIYSRHTATNNAVIIPKLKAGFIISSLEISEVFGVLVHLRYYTNSMRRKLMDYRSGQLNPDHEILEVMKSV